MKFPNALNGSKKLFLAEILALITSILVIIGALTAFSAVKANTDEGAVGSLIGGGALLLIGAIVGILAIIFQFIGVTACSKDEPKFKTALAALIVSLVASVISSFTNGIVKYIFQAIDIIAGIVAIYFIITGFISLANKLERSDVASFGKTVLFISIGVLALSAILTVVAGILSPSDVTNLTADKISSYKTAQIFSIVTAVLGIVQSVIYLIFLNKSKEMLAE